MSVPVPSKEDGTGWETASNMDVRAAGLPEDRDVTKIMRKNQGGWER